MNRAFEKILKKIEEKRNKYQRLADGSNFDGWNEEDIKYSSKAEMCEELKEIVQEVAEEYNGGWIPCSERLPKEFETVLVTMADDCKGFSHMQGSLDIGYWYNKIGFCCACDDYSIDDIIAWQPLPQPYQPNGE